MNSNLRLFEELLVSPGISSNCAYQPWICWTNENIHNDEQIIHLYLQPATRQIIVKEAGRECARKSMATVRKDMPYLLIHTILSMRKWMKRLSLGYGAFFVGYDFFFLRKESCAGYVYMYPMSLVKHQIERQSPFYFGRFCGNLLSFYR